LGFWILDLRALSAFGYLPQRKRP